MTFQFETEFSADTYAEAISKTREALTMFFGHGWTFAAGEISIDVQVAARQTDGRGQVLAVTHTAYLQVRTQRDLNHLEQSAGYEKHK